MTSDCVAFGPGEEGALTMDSTRQADFLPEHPEQHDGRFLGTELPFQAHAASDPDDHVVSAPEPVAAALSQPAGTINATLDAYQNASTTAELERLPDCVVGDEELQFRTPSPSDPDVTVAEVQFTKAGSTSFTMESENEDHRLFETLLVAERIFSEVEEILPPIDSSVVEPQPLAELHTEDPATSALKIGYEDLIMDQEDEVIVPAAAAQHLEEAFRELDLQLPAASLSDVDLLAALVLPVQSNTGSVTAGSPNDTWPSSENFVSPDVHSSESGSEAPPEADKHVTALRKATVAAVDWDFVRFAAALFHGSEHSPRVGKLGYAKHSIVQELLFEDDVTWVARVPLLRSPELPPSEGELAALSQQMSNGVATLRYVSAHTEIPVPKLCYWTSSQDGGGGGLPFRLESLPSGVPLSDLWDDLSADSCSIVLEQMAHIYLELGYKCRLPKIGSLYKRARSSICEALNGEECEPGPILFPPSLEKSAPASHPTGGPYIYGMDYLEEDATACLDSIRTTSFGSKQNGSRYVGCWLLRSLLPHVYHFGHAMADSKGFALFPGDFSLVNIMVDPSADGGPKLTSVLDWDFSSSLPNSSFAQFPPFLQDDPTWLDGDERHSRLSLEQEVLLTHLRAQEITRDIWIPLTNHMDMSRLAYVVGRALHEPELGADYEIWDEVHVGRPQRFDMYWDTLEGLERGALKEQLAEFDSDVGVKERIVTLLDPDGTVDIPEESVQKLLERIRDIPELAEEQAYLEDVLAD
ncbi:hypothetical protein CALVIDRAFT_241294 [Calocera viscosa TUFC12733]|uniref:Aminoglycoside phosphotransferase domain-containing protein n=1 Tax=Calocera viscosa (strain TUFC12733) TaxID=1330018 RepID=A0A167JME4_CALVF|nr:hypothetical protein CALVIDRAFT_241294 [Calocera viscosa TUFC12733]